MILVVKSYIENVDIVFMGIMNKVGEYVVKNFNFNSIFLDDFY